MKVFARSVADAIQFLLRPNRMIRDLKSRQEIFWYTDICMDSPRTSSYIRQHMTLFLFTDAGYASLEESKSIRALIIIFGMMSDGNSIMTCRGWLLSSSSGEISQVARSSLAAEAMSLSGGVDFLQWMRV